MADPADVARKTAKAVVQETAEQKKAREDAEDAATTAAFMGDSVQVKPEAPPASPEELQDARNKAAYEAKEAARLMAADQKRNEDARAIAYANQDLAEQVQRVQKSALTPDFVKAWAIRKIQERANRPTEERVAWATRARQRDIDRGASQHRYDSLVPEVAVTPIQMAKDPRQPTSFHRDDPAEEEAKLETIRRAMQNAAKK